MREEWIKTLQEKAQNLEIQGKKGQIEVTREQGEKLYRYMELLLEWNEKMNLISIEHERAEEAGQKETYRGKWNAVVSRAVAPLPILLEYCIPLLKEGGIFLAYKGPGLSQELEDSSRALSLLGCEVENVYKVSLQEEGWEH